MRKIVGRFAAAGSDGRMYAVEVVQAFAPASGHSTPAPVGDTKLFTANGQPVTRLDDRQYRVNATGVTLTSAVTAR